MESAGSNFGQRRLLDCDPLFSLWIQEGRGVTNGIPSDLHTVASIEDSTITEATMVGDHSLMADEEQSTIGLSPTKGHTNLDLETNEVAPPAKATPPTITIYNKEKDLRAYLLGQKNDASIFDDGRIEQAFRRRKKKLHGGFERTRKSKDRIAPFPEQIQRNALRVKAFEKDGIDFSEMNGQVEQLIREIRIEGAGSGDDSDVAFLSTLPKSRNRNYDKIQIADSNQRVTSERSHTLHSRSIERIAQLVTQLEELQSMRAAASAERRCPSAPRSGRFDGADPLAFRIHRLPHNPKEKRQEDRTNLPRHLRSVKHNDVREPSCDVFRGDIDASKRRESRISNTGTYHEFIDLDSSNDGDHFIYKHQVPPSEQLALGARIARQESEKLARAAHDLSASKLRLRSRSARRARSLLKKR